MITRKSILTLLILIVMALTHSGIAYGIPETQEMMNLCAVNKIYPEIEIIKASEINDTWDRVANKKARYRYVIDATTI